MTLRRRLRRAISARFDRQHLRIAAVERDLARIGPQLAALEARMETLRSRLDRPDVRPHEAQEATALVQQIRQEHERMRARVSAASRFEERLGQLEDQMAEVRRPT